ncbi:adenylate/guanylate cyclase domain-containing protein [Rhizobium sp. KVB221]|uniref:Adenylate/guanylate cyclase domain-containing protein n=1 Tax=Rhizobium setariae TaxID=2801340 RepID=A0A936YWM2_9HYPH|nr:adenylate/guanylate cyclase domain-containing protein [Rhizobium setariae]
MKFETNPRSGSSRELRSISLRFVVFVILIANLLLGEKEATRWTYLVVVMNYMAASVALMIAARYRTERTLLHTLTVVLDAVLVGVILYAHILGAPVTDNHNLTTTSLVVAFILLNHVGLSLKRTPILIFSAIVLTSWIAMLLAMGMRHHEADIPGLLANLVNRDLGLAISFGFTALAIYLIAADHEQTRREALDADQRRINLSRFFSPHVVADLEEGGASLALERRNAAIMFVDLRDFTRFAENAPANELAYVLAVYRDVVSDVVLRHGGTVDKFIGDGVMAVFGQPAAAVDDADRALACALDLVDALDDWKNHCRSKGLASLESGIGLHFGPVVGGVIEAGCHSEYTVIGDVVNVAQRLESVSKVFESPLAVSVSLFGNLTGPIPKANWVTQEAVALPGRRTPIDIAYLKSQ